MMHIVGLPISVWAVLITGVFAGSVVKGITGFGSTIVHLCIWAFCKSLGFPAGTMQQAVLAECIYRTTAAVPLLLLTRAHRTADFKLVTSLTVFQALGAPVGVSLLAILDQRVAELVLACILLLVVTVQIKLPQQALQAMRTCWGCHNGSHTNVGSSSWCRVSSGGDAGLEQRLLWPDHEAGIVAEPLSGVAADSNVDSSFNSSSHNSSSDGLQVPAIGHMERALVMLLPVMADDKVVLQWQQQPQGSLQGMHSHIATCDTHMLLDVSTCLPGVHGALHQPGVFLHTSQAADPHVALDVGSTASATLAQDALPAEAKQASHNATGGVKDACIGLVTEQGDAELDVKQSSCSRTGLLIPPQSLIKMLLLGLVAGTLSGVMAGLTGICGPPVILMFSILDVPKDTARGSNAVMNAVLMHWLLANFIYLGVLHWADMPLYTVAALVGLVGTVLGSRIADMMDQRSFNHALIVLVVVCCASMFASASGLVS